jgi:hypothetical protein
MIPATNTRTRARVRWLEHGVRQHPAPCLALLFLAWFAWGYSGSNARLLGPPLGQMSGQDFRQVLRASREVLEGRSPYSHALAFGRSPSFRDFKSWHAAPYPYPPVVAVLAIPLLSAGEDGALRLWTAVSLALLVGGAAVAAFAFGSVPRRKRFMTVTALVVFFVGYGPTQLELMFVQLDSLILFLLLLTYWLYRRRHRYAGVPLGLAIVVKPLVFPMLGYFAWKRQWRAGLVAAGSATVLMVLGFCVAGWRTLPEYLEVNRLWTSGAMLDYPFNQSVHGLARRAFTLNTYIEPLATAPFVADLLVLGAAVIAVTAWIATVSRDDRRDEVGDAIEYGLTLVALLFLTPLVDDIHFVWVLLPLSSLMVALVADGVERPVPWAAFGVVCCALYLSHPDLHDAVYLGWESAASGGTRVPAALVPLTGAYLYGLIALATCAVLYLRAVRARDADGRDPRETSCTTP